VSPYLVKLKVLELADNIAGDSGDF